MYNIFYFTKIFLNIILPTINGPLQWCIHNFCMWRIICNKSLFLFFYVSNVLTLRTLFYNNFDIDILISTRETK
jgi:hypothetical protein